MHFELEFSRARFRLKISSKASTVQSMVLSFVGYGSAPSGNGCTIKVWNPATSQWENASSGTGSSNQAITISLTSTAPNYVDANGYVLLLAKSTNPSNGTTPAVLNCDYVSCMVTVNGITYLDVVSYQDKDKVDVKPFIFRTIFVLKSWSLEDIGGIF